MGIEKTNNNIITQSNLGVLKTTFTVLLIGALVGGCAKVSAGESDYVDTYYGKKGNDGYSQEVKQQINEINRKISFYELRLQASENQLKTVKDPKIESEIIENIQYYERKVAFLKKELAKIQDIQDGNELQGPAKISFRIMDGVKKGTSKVHKYSFKKGFHTEKIKDDRIKSNYHQAISISRGKDTFYTIEFNHLGDEQIYIKHDGLNLIVDYRGEIQIIPLDGMRRSKYKTIYFDDGSVDLVLKVYISTY